MAFHDDWSSGCVEHFFFSVFKLVCHWVNHTLRCGAICDDKNFPYYNNMIASLQLRVWRGAEGGRLICGMVIHLICLFRNS